MVTIAVSTTKAIYHHRIDLEACGGWIDENFIDEFINNQLLQGEQIESRFLPLPIFDQTVQFVFVPEALYEKAVEKGVIPDSLGYFADQ